MFKQGAFYPSITSHHQGPGTMLYLISYWIQYISMILKEGWGEGLYQDLKIIVEGKMTGDTTTHHQSNLKPLF